jgi:thiol-disulfide isomerase/thioredoxin
MFQKTLAALVASAFLLTGATVAFAAPQDAAPAKKQQKGPPAWQKAYAAGNGFIQSKEYAKAIEEFNKVLEDKETVEGARPIVTYDIGCCHALLGQKEKAVEFVVKSIDLGFYDFDHIKQDDDLKSVRDDAKIAEAMKRNQAKKDALDAEMKKKRDEASKKALEAAHAKLADPAGAGFEFKFDFKTLDGKPISNKEIAGRVAIVDIWGTWCPPCRAEIPHFVELMKIHKNDPFVIVGLNDEDKRGNVDAEECAKKAVDFAKEFKINYPLALIDSNTRNQVPNFRGYPTTLFLDRTGKVRLVQVGSESLEFLDSIVKDLLAEGSTKGGDAKRPSDGKKPEDAKKANGE